MQVNFELTNEDMKKIFPDAFYLMPTSHQLKMGDSFAYPLIFIIIFHFFTDLSFGIILLGAILLGILTYFFISRWILVFLTRVMVWKHKKKFPRKYQLRLYDDYFIYTDLQNGNNHYKIPWDTIENVKVKDNFIFIYVQSINKVLVLNKNVSLPSPTSSQLYIEILKEKLKQI